MTGVDRYPFTDPVTSREVVLVCDPSLGWWSGGVGVEHPECAHDADVSPELDCFYCPACGWNGRVDGAWVVDVWRSAVSS